MTERGRRRSWALVAALGLVPATPGLARASHASASPEATQRAPATGGQAVLVQATVRSSLERALYSRDPAEGRALAAEVARLLRWRGDVVRKVHPGDRIDVLFRAQPAPIEPELLALHFRGRALHLEAFRFAASDDGIARFYDGHGQRIEPTMRNPPVPRYWQISEVVQRGPGRRSHRGDDFKAPAGSAVVLPFAGHVTRTNWHRRRNGRCIEVQLDAGYLAHFLHLQALAPDVRPGRALRAGHVLGTVGNSGRSTAAHLHYELLRQQRPVEPLKVHGAQQSRLQGTDLDAFLPQRDALRRALTGAGAS